MEDTGAGVSVATTITAIESSRYTYIYVTAASGRRKTDAKL